MAIYTAKVKITDLAEQLYNLVSSEDVFPIVDVTGNASKKITVANLQSWLEQNGLATTTELTNESLRATNAEATIHVLLNGIQETINTMTGVDTAYGDQLTAIQDTINTMIGVDTAYGDQLTAIQANILTIENNIDNIEAGTGDVVMDGGTYD
jgi:hypothetical protein